MTLKIFRFIDNSNEVKTGIYFEYGEYSDHFDLMKLIEDHPSLFNNIDCGDIPELLNFLNSTDSVDKFFDDKFGEEWENKYSPDEGWKFAVPLDPPKIIAIARNYSEHAKESGAEISEEPIFFSKFITTLLPHKGVIELPKDIGRIDHEIELGVIFGKDCKNTPEDSVMENVCGYTIFNDITAREQQSLDKEKGHPYTRSKGHDTFGPCGPYIIPKKYIKDPYNLELVLLVNGEFRQDGNTKDIVFSIETLVSFISKGTTLQKGDLLITGTPSGVSPLKSGDVITAAISEIGILENPCK